MLAVFYNELADICTKLAINSTLPSHHNPNNKQPLINND